jgi:hypothetical protein
MMPSQDWWGSTREHCRELAGWLRQVASKCRLPNPQRELLNLARTYERRAEHLEKRPQPEGVYRPDEIGGQVSPDGWRDRS